MSKNVPIVALLLTGRYRGSKAGSSDTRKKVIYACRKTCGNVTAPCDFAGIDRKTFQRWMRSTTPVNLKFQRRINAIEPIEHDFTRAAVAPLAFISTGAGDSPCDCLFLRLRRWTCLRCSLITKECYPTSARRKRFRFDRRRKRRDAIAMMTIIPAIKTDRLREAVATHEFSIRSGSGSIKGGGSRFTNNL
jgi:hypothetical protein